MNDGMISFVMNDLDLLLIDLLYSDRTLLRGFGKKSQFTVEVVGGSRSHSDFFVFENHLKIALNLY